MQNGPIQRSPRFDLVLPVRFFSEAGLFSGETVNLSDSGMLVRFERPADAWLEGELVFTFDGEHHSVAARVARAEGLLAGMAFHRRGRDDARTVERLLDLAGTAPR